MSEQEKLVLIEDAMDVDEGSLSIETVLNDLEEWDSLSTLALTIAVKQKMGLNLTGNIIKNFVTVEDICNYLG